MRSRKNRQPKKKLENKLRGNGKLGEKIDRSRKRQTVKERTLYRIGVRETETIEKGENKSRSDNEGDSR